LTRFSGSGNIEQTGSPVGGKVTRNAVSGQEF